jgi:hypothetical protein
VRVSVSLSDREHDDWRDSAACRDMDPRDFDDGGTPSAWQACKTTCQVVKECRADCFKARPRGVYRAGRYWPEKYGEQAVEKTPTAERLERWAEWATLRELGMTLQQIANATGHSHATVLNALRKMGAA